MIRRDKNLISNEISVKLIESCIDEHKKGIARLTQLDSYYCGKHNIENREIKGELAPNNKITNNFPKYITDTACGYVLGNPVIYKGSETQDLTEFHDYLKSIDIDTHDAELEKDLSVFGVGHELLYMSQDSKPKLALIDPRNAFVVYDDTVECNPLFGVTYYPEHDESGAINKMVIKVYSSSEEITYKANATGSSNSDISNVTYVSRVEHYFGGVPLLQYWNNEEGMGDFEGVLSLVDAYNILQSDRINDKERFVDAILLIINADLNKEDAKKVIVEKLLQLPESSDARYITKTLNETETQVLANAIKDDIHKFSHTPDFTDEKFSGNTSGVAMAYKLLPLENLAKIKERFFKSGLRERLKLLSRIDFIKGKSRLDVDKITIIMNRTLPVNELEVAQMINLLKDTVSLKTLLSKLPFVEDVEIEAEAVKEEKKESQDNMINSFSRGNYDSNEV